LTRDSWGSRRKSEIRVLLSTFCIHTRYKQTLSGEEKTVYYSSSSSLFHALWYEPLIFLFLFLSLSLFLDDWFDSNEEVVSGCNRTTVLSLSSFIYIYIYIYMSPNTLPVLSITNDYVNRQSWVVIEKNTCMKDSFVFNKIYYIVLMSKRLKTKKKPRQVEREEKKSTFLKK
jgi:hypothetical protein